MKAEDVCYAFYENRQAERREGFMKMQIGEIIRKYRKSNHMTQEEMAERLGVSAPAVNKWENGNSMPDIMLLAPITRQCGKAHIKHKRNHLRTAFPVNHIPDTCR